MATSATVSVIGLGRMGAAMVRTLVRTGCDVVVWNRDPTKVADLAGDKVVAAPTAADAAANAKVVITSLADDAAVEAVYLGHDGVVAGVSSGSVVVDTSTIDPRTVERVGTAVDATGAHFLDGPVSGSVATVAASGLTVMVGGDADALAAARPIIDRLAAKVVHVGPRGAGAATKLAVNALVHGLNVALAEALVLAERAGIDRAVAYEVFAGGAAGAPFVQYKRDSYLHPEATPVAFSLDLVAKDLDLITTLAARVGAPMDQAHTGLDLVTAAVAAGLGSADMSALADHLRTRAS